MQLPIQSQWHMSSRFIPNNYVGFSLKCISMYIEDYEYITIAL